MKKNQIVKTLLRLCLLAIRCMNQYSCKNKGCTEASACNFDSKAKENTGCDYSCCETGTVIENSDSVCINYNGTGTYAIAVFTIKKEKIEFPVNCSKPVACKNYLSIKNITDYSISFNYKIDYMLNGVNWSYQNSVTNLAMGKTTEAIVMNDNCESIKNGTITIVTR